MPLTFSSASARTAPASGSELLSRVLAALAVAVALTLPFAALAAPVVNLVDSDPNVGVAFGGSHHYRHDVSSANLGAGPISAALLEIALLDDGGSEKLVFVIEGIEVPDRNVARAGIFSIDLATLPGFSLAQLAASAMLDIEIKALRCNRGNNGNNGNNGNAGCTGSAFVFDSSRLTVQASQPPGGNGRNQPGINNSVPEPATLGLLGFGFGALALVRRRRSDRK